MDTCVWLRREKDTFAGVEMYDPEDIDEDLLNDLAEEQHDE